LISALHCFFVSWFKSLKIGSLRKNASPTRSHNAALPHSGTVGLLVS
ncbi:unnamed protein product, partial [Musa banksii]